MITIMQGHVLDQLKEIPQGSVQTVVTSPPYWGLRDYGIEPQVWGGAPCDHVWGEERKTTRSGGTASSTLGAASGGHDMSDEARVRSITTSFVEASQGAFCQSCTAWRGSLGLEPSPALYVSHLVEVFAAVWRVLADTGTLWINLGDSYAGSWGAQSRPNGTDEKSTLRGGSMLSARQIVAHPRGQTHTGSLKHTPGLKPKDLCGIPWRVAFALQEAGWYLRSAAPWVKRAAMPESVQDRPSSAVEYFFLLTKRPDYFYDIDAVRKPLVAGARGSSFVTGKTGVNGAGRNSLHPRQDNPNGRNRRNSDWWFESVGMLLSEDGEVLGIDVPLQPFPGSHFATFAPALVEPCILAGSKPGDTVLDPFGGSGTVGLVADRLGRDAVLIELNPEYCTMAQQRIVQDAPLFGDVRSHTNA